MDRDIHCGKRQIFLNLQKKINVTTEKNIQYTISRSPRFRNAFDILRNININLFSRCKEAYGYINCFTITDFLKHSLTTV